MGFFDRLKKGLTRTRESLTAKIEKAIIGYADIDDDLLDELEEIMIMADVGVTTTEKLITPKPISTLSISWGWKRARML